MIATARAEVAPALQGFRRDLTVGVRAEWRELLTVALVVAAVTTANLIWIHIDEHPPHWDMGGHLSSSLLYNRYLTNLDVVTFFGTYIVYPPLVYWLAQPFYLIFGEDISVAVASQTIFLIVLAFSTYGVGRELWSKRTGLLAVFFVLASPFLVSQFKEYQLDAPLASMTALSLFLLIKSREFSDRKYSLLLGVALGLSMLTKWPFAFVIAFPMTYALAIAFLRRHSDARPLRNVVHVAVIGLVTAAPWYLGHIDLFLEDVLDIAGGYGAREGDPEVLSWASFEHYFWVLVNGQLYLIPFLAFCTGLVVMLIDRQNARRNLYPLLLIAGCYVLFTLLRNKDARYIVPMMSGVAIVAVYWIELIRPRVLAYLAAAGVVVYTVVAFLAISFTLPLVPSDKVVRIGDESVRLFAERGYIIGPPSRDDWYQEEIIRTAAADPDLPPTLHFRLEGVPDHIWFTGPGLRYFSMRHGVEMTPERDAAFLLIRTRDNVSPAVPAGFRVDQTYSLPDGSKATLMRRSQ